MNRLSQQESENEIKMFAMTGQIEQETRRAELLKVLQTHKLMEAKNEGEAEAERVRAFLASRRYTRPPTYPSRVSGGGGSTQPHPSITPWLHPPPLPCPALSPLSNRVSHDSND